MSAMHNPLSKSNNISQLELIDEPTKTYSVKTSRIYLASIAVNISALAVGTCLSWPSPIGPKLRSLDPSESPLSKPLSTNEEAWISSIVCIGALITPFFAGPLADKFGRKNVLLSSSLLFILGYKLLLLGKEFWVLLVGRLIKGFGIGFVMCVSPMYVGEISSDETRGATGAIMPLCIVTGLYFVLCIGPFVSYMVLQCICLFVPLIFIVTFVFMPESPFHYVAKGQRSMASKALQFLRSQSAAAVEGELVSIENLIEASKAEQAGMLDVVKTAGNRRALLISLGLIFFQQVSGLNVVLFYTQTIFESAHLTFSAAISSIIVGTVEVVACAIAPLVVHKFGRKILLMNSAVFMSIGLASLGYYFFAEAILGDTTGITWLPLTALLLYIVALAAGFSSLPWIILSEIFPPNVKSIAAASTVSVCWASGFLVPLFYPHLVALGTFYAFWLFAAFCVVAFFFVFFFVFETRGLSLEEIQNKLNK